MYIDSQTKQMQESSNTWKLAMKCVHYLLWCLEKCLKFLTKFAYIYVAIENDPFCTAAVKTYKLVTAFPLQLAANEIAMAVLSLLMTILTPLACSTLAYLSVLKSWRNYVVHADVAGIDAISDEHRSTFISGRDKVLGFLGVTDWSASEGPPSEFVIAVTTLLLSYWVTQMFKMVYATAVDTLFVCMVRDDSLGGQFSSADQKKLFKAAKGDKKEEGGEGKAEALPEAEPLPKPGDGPKTLL